MENCKKILSTLKERCLHHTHNILEYIYFQKMQRKKNRLFEFGKLE